MENRPAAAASSRAEELFSSWDLLAKPSWPDQYNNAIPLFAAQIYQLKKKDLKNADLGKEWMNTCMSN